MEEAIPKMVGKYEVIKEIGRGSMGVVYLGFDPYINRSIAIKVALSHLLQTSDDESRFQRFFFNEARIAGMLDHTNILPIYDAGIDNNKYYIVMEYIHEGRTLVEFCKIDNLLPIKNVLEIIFKCCKALDYAHRRGVIHRDIKPSNIMVTKNLDVKIGDFGIAQIVKSDMTQVMGLVGSPRYMSPEQAKEEELTNHTDIFSLGVIMYELLTGRQPFQAENLSSLIYKIVNEDPVLVRQYRPEIPEIIENVVNKALNKKIDERYSMGKDFAADLSKASKKHDYRKDEIDEKEKFNAMKKLNFFKEFYDSEIWEVLRCGAWKEFHPDEQIVVEGEMDDSFYIIISGKVAVRKGEKDLVVLGSGDCFGEMGYISKEKRTASIFSIVDVALLQINSTLIDQASQGCQLRFIKVFLKTLIERLSRTSKNLSDSEQ